MYVFTSRSPGRTGPLILAVVLSGTVAACDNAPVQTPTEAPAARSASTPGAALSPKDGRLRDLSRAMAITLGKDPSLRLSIAKDFANSPHRESKLDFDRIANDEAGAIASAVRHHAGTDIGLLARSIGPLELYIPWPDHKSWSGSDHFYVASHLSDEDGSNLWAFDSNGDPVELSFAGPPETPTLVLVPAETDFSKVDRSNTAAQRHTALTQQGSGNAIRMVSNYLTNVHEPWTMGNPELAVHVAVFDDENDISATWTICAGDNVVSPYYYDQNGSSWSGSVNIAGQSHVQGKLHEVYIWEDDYQRCDGTNYLKPHRDDPTYLDALVAARAAYRVYSGSGGWIQSILDAGSALYQLAANVAEDDFVGVAVVLPGLCYEVRICDKITD